MAKTTVYVPDDLKAEMDAVTEDVSWSGVAVQAFRMKLAEIASRKKSKTMADVKTRLRASKMKAAETNTSAGFKVGKRWAQDKAEWSDIERIAELADPHLVPDSAQGPGGLAWWLVSEGALTGTYGRSAEDWHRDGEEAWRMATREHPDRLNNDFAEGFCNGVIAVCEELADEL